MDIPLLLLAGAGVWFLAEGVLYAAAPGAMRKLAQILVEMPQRDVVIGGAITAAMGALLLTLAVRSA